MRGWGRAEPQGRAAGALVPVWALPACPAPGQPFLTTTSAGAALGLRSVGVPAPRPPYLLPSRLPPEPLFPSRLDGPLSDGQARAVPPTSWRCPGLLPCSGRSAPLLAAPAAALWAHAPLLPAPADRGSAFCEVGHSLSWGSPGFRGNSQLVSSRVVVVPAIAVACCALGGSAVPGEAVRGSPRSLWEALWTGEGQQCVQDAWHCTCLGCGLPPHGE